MSSVVGFAQFGPDYGNPKSNRSTMRGLAEQAGAFDLLVFPELAVTGYDLRDAGHALTLSEAFGDGPSSVWALELARDRGGSIVVGYAEREGDRVYNSCLMATPNGDLYNYRKIHLFSREKELFSPGDVEPPVIEIEAGRVGLMICFDWIFPEVTRALAVKGMDVLAHPSNLVLRFCQKSMPVRCVENGIYTLFFGSI